MFKYFTVFHKNKQFLHVKKQRNTNGDTMQFTGDKNRTVSSPQPIAIIAIYISRFIISDTAYQISSICLLTQVLYLHNPR